jgi:hypothetical protein
MNKFTGGASKVPPFSVSEGPGYRYILIEQLIPGTFVYLRDKTK